MEQELKHYGFVNRYGAPVRTTREGLIPLGRAYAFFDLKAPKRAIEAEFPKARKAARTPSELELSLTEGVGDRVDPGLLREIGADRKIYPITSRKLRGREKPEPVKISNIRYMLEATYSGATNKEAAGELGDVMSSLSYGLNDEDYFTAAVVYKDQNGEFVERK